MHYLLPYDGDAFPESDVSPYDSALSMDRGPPKFSLFNLQVSLPTHSTALPFPLLQGTTGMNYELVLPCIPLPKPSLGMRKSHQEGGCLFCIY